ncbi:UDP-N-acetylglucosamine 2-epimerase (non-hydrolyzing) [archaeon CG10_big_fil_rev_8_21_14_0_10_43_11]|nr:MAG: UDP-N-acetylglucosamine 2-epimerase (non-hydrolyzing) [archaeon CG10_big_fil_rev_8_21_14_0_10_43_11]
MNVGIFFGTRPEIVKLSRLMFLSKQKYADEFSLIHTGQHYSYSMSGQFMDELALPSIDYNLGIGSGTHNYQIGSMLLKLERLIKEKDIDTMVILGDTNSALAGALCANRSGIRVCHIEAGIRSFDRTMPEEINRILTDAVSNHCYAPTTIAVEHLKKENISDDRIFLTGNVIVDALNYYLPLAKKRERIIPDESYGLVTLHRPANVDRKEKLLELVNALNTISVDNGLPLYFPIHPRTRNNLEKFGLLKKIKLNLIDPLGYFDFLRAMSESKIMITDSGGLQEESCILGVPCATIRENTERPETVHIGSNYLCGTTYSGIVEGVNIMLNKKPDWKQPYGDGRSSERILNLIQTLN